VNDTHDKQDKDRLQERRVLLPVRNRPHHPGKDQEKRRLVMLRQTRLHAHAGADRCPRLVQEFDGHAMIFSSSPSHSHPHLTAASFLKKETRGVSTFNAARADEFPEVTLAAINVIDVTDRFHLATHSPKAMILSFSTFMLQFP
jgi:hypothetical protein